MNLGIHHVQGDEIISPRWGLFFFWDGEHLFSVEVILAIAGIRRHRQLVDFRTRAVLARKVYWARWVLHAYRTLPKGYRRLQFCRGSQPHHQQTPLP